MQVRHYSTGFCVAGEGHRDNFLEDTLDRLGLQASSGGRQFIYWLPKLGGQPLQSALLSNGAIHTSSAVLTIDPAPTP